MWNKWFDVIIISEKDVNILVERYKKVSDDSVWTNG